MLIPPKSQDISFEEFLKELPADYHEMAYEFKAFTRSRKIKSPGQLLQVVMPLYFRQTGQSACESLPELRLNIADYLRKATSDLVSIPIWLHSKGRSCLGMIHAQRLPPAAAEAARRRCRQDGNRKGRTPAQDTLYLAGWFMVFTTVSEEVMAASTVIELYRTRWQVELVFERLKSLLDLDLLRTQKDSLLGKVWITGKLLYATVIERHVYKRFGHDWNQFDQIRMTTPWRLLKVVRSLINSWIIETHR